MGQAPDTPRLELEQTQGAFQPAIDRRPYMPEPLPVKLVAVEDVHALAAAGMEAELDFFYVGLLQFERDQRGGGLVYRAENARLIFQVLEPPLQRQDLRPMTIEVQSLAEAEAKLVQHEIEYARQRGITSGSEQLVLQDPAGNWVEIVQSRKFSW